MCYKVNKKKEGYTMSKADSDKRKNPIQIRIATLDDAQQILNIYAYYVLHTAITYEYDVPSIEEFRGRMENTLKRYPYFVAEQDGMILGYAYANPFHVRAAYDWSAEVTIYLSKEAKKCGLGRKMYEVLEAALKKMGILNLYACIGYPEVEDEYLDYNSARFHEHLGYVKIGEFHKCGYKFGRWYHMIWMEKIIGEHKDEQAPVRNYEKSSTSE